jgi:predicted DCC family thiol-disulfide oxidoreductase YuxK
VIGPSVDWLYDVWAANRLRITGRPEMEQVLRDRAEKLRQMEPVDCSTECKVD